MESPISISKQIPKLDKIISGTLYLPSGESFKLLNNPNVPYKILKSNTVQKSTQNAELPLNEIKDEFSKKHQMGMQSM